MAVAIPRRGALVDRMHPLSRDLVAAYAFNEGTGEVIRDLSGNENDVDDWSDLASSDWGPGNAQLGTALHFGAVDTSYAQTTKEGWFITNELLTGMIWCCPAAADKTIVGMTTEGNFILKITAASKFWGRLGGGSFTFDTAITLGTWHQVTLVGDSPLARPYLDGHPDRTPYNYGSGGYSSTDNLIFGRPNSYDFEGPIGLCYLWHRPLSAAEVAWLYLDPWAPFPWRKVLEMNPTGLLRSRMRDRRL